MSQITVLDKSNTPTGPFTREQIADRLRSGDFTLNDLAFVEGLAQWTPLGDVLAKVDGGTPPIPPIPPAPLAGAPVYSYAATMQPPAHLVYAGFWIRAAAHILDNLIVSVPFIFIWVIIVSVAVGTGVFTQLVQQQRDGQPTAPSPALVGTIILLYLFLIFGRIVVVWLYHAILESGPHEATWGKRIVGLKVTSFSGQRISFKHASGRYFSTFITGMTMGVGYLMVAFTERKQALHDMIAGTLVIKG
jgi:uncharacterized RDD family membrane protein YckC